MWSPDPREDQASNLLAVCREKAVTSFHELAFDHPALPKGIEPRDLSLCNSLRDLEAELIFPC